MKKYLVITYFEGLLDIAFVKNTFKEAREAMIYDIEEYTNEMDQRWLIDCTIRDDYGFVNYCGDICEWFIKEIEV